jgi:MFS transporter, YQGE family, putative transporter
MEAIMQNEKLSRLKISLEYHTGLAEIPAATKKFIFTHFNFLLFTTIPGVFINTFFFNQDGKISTVSIYTAITCFGMALVMHISSQISLKKSPAYVLRLGVAIFNIFYITLLLLQSNAAKFMILLGILNAIASGFYWQGYNEMMKLCTSEGIFDKTVSLIGLAGAVVTLVIPLISGLIITYCPGQIGYTIIFAISFVFSLYTTYLTTQLEKSKIAGKSNLKGVYRYIFTNKSVLAANFAELMRGIRNSAFPLFLTIIFYKLVSNEALLGVNNMLCGLASILSYIIAGRVLRPGNRLKSILTACLISIVLFLPMFYSMNPAVIFVLAIVNACICAFIDNPAIAFFYSLFEKPIDGITFSQIMSVREIFFATGRAIGLVLLIIFSRSNLMLAIFVLLLNISIIFSWALFRFFVKGQQNGGL